MHGPAVQAGAAMLSKSQHLRAGALRHQPEGLLEGWRERRSGSMRVDDEEPEGPSRTVLLGEQATRTRQSSAQAVLLQGSLAWGCGQARRAAWASCQGVARSPARDRVLLPLPATPRERAPRGEELHEDIA